MHRPHAPTVRQLPPVRRLIAGALIAGAVAATAPAMASAAPNTESICTYDAVFHRVTVTDKSGGAKLTLVRTGDVIAVQDGNANITHCGNLSGFATVTNTDKIIINTPGSLDDFSGIAVDQRGGRLAPGFTAENDGTSEIEVLVRLTGPNSPALEIIGTPEAETIRASARGKRGRPSGQRPPAPATPQ
jgi:hypothetical protein